MLTLTGVRSRIQFIGWVNQLKVGMWGDLSASLGCHAGRSWMLLSVWVTNDDVVTGGASVLFIVGVPRHMR